MPTSTVCAILHRRREPKPPRLLMYAAAVVLSVLTSTWQPCSTGRNRTRARLDRPQLQGVDMAALPRAPPTTTGPPAFVDAPPTLRGMHPQK